MKICFINFVGIPTRTEAAKNNLIGGLNTILINLCENLVKYPNVSVDCIFRHQEDYIPYSNRDYQMIGVQIGPPGPLPRNELMELLDSNSAEVFKAISLSKPDIIHTAGVEAAIVMLKLRNEGFDTPWVHTNFATIGVRRFLLEKVDKSRLCLDPLFRRELACLQACDHIVALSHDDKSEICATYDVREEKVSVICPGVEKNIFYFDGRYDRKPIIITAGRMSPIKDFPFLIRSFGVFKDSHSRPEKLVIVGGSRTEKESLNLEGLIKDLNLQDSVVLVDGVSQEQLAQMFRSSKIFVGSSKHETFGLLPVEAMACGLPAIVRNVSGYRETALDSSWVVENEWEMADKMYSTLSLSRSAYNNLCDRSVACSNKHSWAASANRHLVLYEKLIVKVSKKSRL